MSRWFNAPSGFARHSGNVFVAFFLSLSIFCVFGRNPLKSASENKKKQFNWQSKDWQFAFLMEIETR